MAGRKSTGKRADSDIRLSEIAEQLESAFMAGLGALSGARKKGAETFESLIEEGEKFRDKATSRSESLIDDVQGAIRDMAGDAQSKATGLLDQVRDRSNLDKLQSAFDTRVADAMDRLNVPSKNDINAINKKLNRIIRLLDEQGKPAAKKKAARRPAAKKAAAGKKAAGKVSKTTK
ncbi:MAG: phasin family protein [Proteobacteria bacterium]|nr:phasin family protein [Pseudomonadota bacterium]